jgi:tRNA G18 (ribose-2'-O)-methylase SpoU
MMSGVGVESLNAAIAASIFMWELTKNEGHSV